MGKYGKWIGGGLGWALGGPIGGILGFMFGSMFDSVKGGEHAYQGGAQGHPYGNPNGTGASTTRPGDFSVSLLILSAAMMKADGQVLKSELTYVKQFLEQQFGKERSSQLVLMLREVLKQSFNLQEVSQQIGHHMDYSSKLQLLHYLFGISMADGQIHTSEINAIAVISNYMGIRQQDLNSIKAMFVKETDSAYKVLEVKPDASDEEIRKAYRKMANQYHPDKVSHLGEDVQRAAKEKFQKLNDAYNQIKTQRGIK